MSLRLKNLDEFYNEKNNIEFVNNVNGEEKRAKEDDLIKEARNIIIELEHQKETNKY